MCFNQKEERIGKEGGEGPMDRGKVVSKSPSSLPPDKAAAAGEERKGGRGARTASRDNAGKCRQISPPPLPFRPPLPPPSDRKEGRKEFESVTNESKSVSLFLCRQSRPSGNFYCLEDW